MSRWNIGTSVLCSSRSAFGRSTGNDVSGHFKHHYFLFFLFSPLSTFLIEGVLGSKNLYGESCWEHPKTEDMQANRAGASGRLWANQKATNKIMPRNLINYILWWWDTYNGRWITTWNLCRVKSLAIIDFGQARSYQLHSCKILFYAFGTKPWRTKAPSTQ